MFAAPALVGPPLRAAEELQEATVIKAGDGKITLTCEGNDKSHTHDVTRDAQITLGDKGARLGDPKEGFPVEVAWDDKFVTRIEAKSK